MVSWIRPLKTSRFLLLEPVNITLYDKDSYIIKDVAIVRFSWIICVGHKYNHRNFPGGPVTKTPHSQHRGPVSIHMSLLRSHMSQLKIPDATAKTQGSQINKLIQK